MRMNCKANDEVDGSVCERRREEEEEEEGKKKRRREEKTMQEKKAARKYTGLVSSRLVAYSAATRVIRSAYSVHVSSGHKSYCLHEQPARERERERKEKVL